MKAKAEAEDAAAKAKEEVERIEAEKQAVLEANREAIEKMGGGQVGLTDDEVAILNRLGFTTADRAALVREGCVKEALAREISPEQLRAMLAPPTAMVVDVAKGLKSVRQEIARQQLQGEIPDAWNAGLRAERRTAVVELQAMLAEKRPADRKKPLVAPILLVDVALQKCLMTALDPAYAEATPVLLADWVRPIEELTALSEEVEDWRLIKYAQVAAASLANAIRATLDTCPEILIIDSSHPAADTVLEVLTPYAALVLRKVGR
jgi:hypothetical protein